MMKNKSLIFILIFLITGILLLIYFFLPFISSGTTEERSVQSFNFFEEKLFFEGITKAQKTAKSLPYKIRGGIIPHDIFSSFIIADFFSRLLSQKPINLVLLGPNHQEKGKDKAITSLSLWYTPFGNVEPNKELCDELIKYNLATINDEIIFSDQSIMAILPFIKYYLPSVKIVPLLLSSKMTLEDIEILSEKLTNYLKSEKTVMIASVDFSHYLNKDMAEQKDEESINILKNFNYKKLLTLNSDYLDSPPSIATILMTMQKNNSAQFDILFHANSGQLQKNNSQETTSYFSLAFY